MKKERSHPASCHDQTDYYQSAYQIRNSQIPTANGTELATTANGESKFASQERISFEPAPSGASTVDETDSNITKVDSSIAMDNYVFTASVDSYETATVEKTSDCKQRDIISPPKVHMVTSSKDIEFLVFPEADRIREPATTHNDVDDDWTNFLPCGVRNTMDISASGPARAIKLGFEFVLVLKLIA